MMWQECQMEKILEKLQQNNFKVNTQCGKATQKNVATPSPLPSNNNIKII